MADDHTAVTTISYVVAHNLVKEQHTKVAQVDLRGTTMPVTPLAQKLVDLLFAEYTRKASKSFGKFDGNAQASPSQAYLYQYFVAKAVSFYDFTAQMMNALRDEAKKAPSSTGGHVFFAHLAKDESEYLLVAVITDEQAIALTEDKDLEPVQHLNLKGFRFAGRVDLTAWRLGVDRYVSFLKGSGDVADYFKTFLACDSTISNLKDTQQLRDAVLNFASLVQKNGSPINEHDRDTLMRRIDIRCREMADAGEPLHLESFANEMWPDAPNELLDVLTHESYQLNDGFVPNKRGLGGLVKFSGKSDFWRVEFERDALQAKKVVFCEEDQSIRLYDPPAHLVDQLKNESA